MKSEALYDVVIVGGALSGISCAETLRTEGFDGSILIICGENHLPYNRPPLSKQVLLGKWEANQTAIFSAEKFGEWSLNILLGKPATALDMYRKCVWVGQEQYFYRKLVIATGVAPRKLQLAEGLEHTFSLRTIEDVTSISEKIETSSSVAVIGAGVLGCEIASACVQLGREVLIVEKSSAPQIPNSGGFIAAKIFDALHKRNVNMQYDVEIDHLTDRGQALTLKLSNGNVFNADMLVVAVGSKPNTEWLEGSGLDLSDGVICSDRGEAAPDIFAIGDVANWADEKGVNGRRRENQTSAIEQGIAVGRYLVTGEVPKQTRSFFWSEILGNKILIIGILHPDRDRLRMLQGNLEDDKFIIATEVDGRFSGILSWNMPKEFREARKLVEVEKNG